MSAAAIFLALSLLAQAGANRMNSLEFPPRDPAADETSADPSPAFDKCEQLIKAFVKRGKLKVVSRRYTLSQTWGQVLRVMVELSGSTTANYVVCWSKPGSGVQFVADMSGETP